MKKEKAKITIKSMVGGDKVSSDIRFTGTSMDILIALAGGTLDILERINAPLKMYLEILEHLEDINQ